MFCSVFWLVSSPAATAFNITPPKPRWHEKKSHFFAQVHNACPACGDKLDASCWNAETILIWDPGPLSRPTKSTKYWSRPLVPLPVHRESKIPRRRNLNWAEHVITRGPTSCFPDTFRSQLWNWKRKGSRWSVKRGRNVAVSENYGRRTRR